MFLAWKKSEHESKNGSQITKKRFRATPHQRVEKNTLQSQKMNPKSWKTRGFFTFFWPRFGGRGNEQVYSVLFVFYNVLWRRASRPIKNRRFFPNKGPPPQVNLNLSWLMPSRMITPLAPSVRADLSIKEWALTNKFNQSWFHNWRKCNQQNQDLINKIWDFWGDSW